MPDRDGRAPLPPRDPVYYARAVALVCDELEKLAPEKLHERRTKMVAILRHAALAFDPRDGRAPHAEPQERELALNDIATLLFAFWHAPYPSTRAQIEAVIARHVDGVTIAQLRQCDLSAEQHQLREALRQCDEACHLIGPGAPNDHITQADRLEGLRAWVQRIDAAEEESHQLREELAAEESNHRTTLRLLQQEITTNDQLREALRTYGQHKAGCCKRDQFVWCTHDGVACNACGRVLMEHDNQRWCRCTCGFSALLTAGDASAGET